MRLELTRWIECDNYNHNVRYANRAEPRGAARPDSARSLDKISRDLTDRNQSRRGPVGWIVVEAVTASADDQHQLSLATHVDRQVLGRAGAGHRPAAVEAHAVGPDFEVDRAPVAHFIVHADARQEL